MTTKKSFEDAYTKRYPVTVQFMPNKFDVNELGEYEDPAVIVGWSMWQAATAAALSAPATTPAQPAWHDAPTCPGLWMGWHNHVHQIEAGDLRKFSLNSGLRWFGPIPEDKP